MSDRKEKSSFFKRILHHIKDLIYKYCGKARWFLLLLLVAGTGMEFMNHIDSILYRNSYYLGEEYTSSALTETPLCSVRHFSVSHDGTAVFLCDIGSNGLAEIMNLNTGTHSYSNTYHVATKRITTQTFIPSDIAVSDDHILYAVRPYYNDDLSNDVIIKESIVRISEQYSYMDEVCSISYDVSEHLRKSKLSRLHYYDGTLTFAVIDKNKVLLYSIDTVTNAVRISREYPTGDNGTYTVNVIPVDGAFLFITSDGNVYRTGFDEPLGERIYHFDNTPSAPFFTQAVFSDGALYAFDENKPTRLFRIADGEAAEVFDVAEIAGHEESAIKIVASCRPQDLGNDVLTVCLSDGLFFYSDDVLSEKHITVKADTDMLIYIVSLILGYMFDLALLGLLINLIIRKKTLLYKQILVTVPIFTALTVVIAVRLYGAFSDQINSTAHRETEIICELTAKELDGYDFSGLMAVNEDTGEQYHRLCEILNGPDNSYLTKWSEDYVFSVLCRTQDDGAAVLAQNDMLCMPMCTETWLNSEKDFYEYDSSGRFYVSETINRFLSYEAKNSEISAFERINDSEGSGKIYLKVSTASRRFWNQRRELIIAIFGYSALVILLLVAIIFLTSFYITHAIKRATGTVKRISEGDLSARTQYRSNDELGEICAQVNAMGMSLETLFGEKDKAEKFYYKFVPEQFRTLLGKEKFTDLALGDSSSRELTVLFFDIRAFSINSEIMTAKENFEFVNVIYGIAAPIIRENHGFVDKYIGDAVMALFENADDAVKSGIEIYRAIVLDPHTAERAGISDLNIGIGIHSGMARIGVVGETERLSGTVISDTVNLSSRLEGLTKQYKTAMLISKDTVDRMTDPDSLDMRYLGLVQVAGVNEVKALYEVLDCLPETERKIRHDNSRTLREAIRLFHLGRRAETLEMLRSISDSGNGDHVTRMYLEYLTALSPDDKGNVFRFSRK